MDDLNEVRREMPENDGTKSLTEATDDATRAREEFNERVEQQEMLGYKDTPDGPELLPTAESQPTVTIPLAEYDEMRQRYAEMVALIEIQEEEKAEALPTEVIEPLPEIMIDGVLYKRTPHGKFTMAQFDRASAVITSLSSILGVAFSKTKTTNAEGKEIEVAAITVKNNGEYTINFGLLDFGGIGAAIEKALMQDRKALLDVAAIVYVAEGATFNDDYPFDEHQLRISGGSADMFMEGAAVFFAFYRRFLSGAGQIFSALKGTRTR